MAMRTPSGYFSRARSNKISRLTVGYWALIPATSFSLNLPTKTAFVPASEVRSFMGLAVGAPI